MDHDVPGASALHRHRFYRAALSVAFGVLGCCVDTAPALGQGVGSLGGPNATKATPSEIAELIGMLGAGSYDERINATRRLCAVGGRAREQLTAAAKSTNFEVALRAQRVLDALERVWFSDLEVSISFSRSEIEWDSAVDLVVTFTNRSPAPSRIPLDLDHNSDANGTADLGDTDAEAQAARRDAAQVGALLDVADFLVVRSPEGRMVELRVNDISAEPLVFAAVQQRLTSGPVSEVPPGARVAYRVSAFNRGWARYPLLDVGAYTVQFVYTPEWDDAVLKSQEVGRVSSTAAVLTVTAAAPKEVSRSGTEASLSLVRDGADLVARLINHSDQPVWINTNFGAAAPFAEGEWVFAAGGPTRGVPLVPRPGPSWQEFRGTSVIEVPAGAGFDVSRIPRAEIERQAKAFAADGPPLERWMVQFQYSNICDRAWQTRQGAALQSNERAPEALRRPLPVRMLSARMATGMIPAVSVEP